MDEPLTQERKLSAAESRQGTDSEASKYLLRQLLAIDTKLAEQCYAYGNISGFRKDSRYPELSACETGLGHATPEGIYGLQRAFRKAGVRYLLVNVGEASDVASSLFMAEFYKAVVRNGCDIHDAFRKARQTVRQRYPDPYYWSGFLLLD